MDVFEAAYRLAHDFKPGGAVGLARVMGVNPGTFLNKLNPHQETHALQLGEAVRMSTATGDARILEAFAETMGRVTLSLPEGPPCDLALIELLLARDERTGAFSRALAEALEDGRITRPEARELRHWALQTVQALMDLVNRIEDMIDD